MCPSELDDQMLHLPEKLQDGQQRRESTPSPSIPVGTCPCVSLFPLCSPPFPGSVARGGTQSACHFSSAALPSGALCPPVPEITHAPAETPEGVEAGGGSGWCQWSPLPRAPPPEGARPRGDGSWAAEHRRSAPGARPLVFPEEIKLQSRWVHHRSFQMNY